MTPSIFDISERIACVTGASSGIGRHLATALATAGAKVVGVARRGEELEAWRAEAGGTTAALAADVSDPAQMEDVGARIAEPFGPPDILITAAGINTREAADDVTLEGWSKTMSINLAAPFFLAQALVPGMKRNGWGRILNIASLQTVRAMPGGVAYGASKAGIAQLTRAEAEAWSRFGVTANALAPGFFETNLTAAIYGNEELVNKNAAQTCIGRNGRLDDLVGPALFLCSPASDYVTGQVLFVDGGFTAK